MPEIPAKFHPEVREGARLKLTLTGKVLHVPRDGRFATVLIDATHDTITICARDDVEVDIIQEPQHETGGVYRRLADGAILIWTQDGWNEITASGEVKAVRVWSKDMALERIA